MATYANPEVTIKAPFSPSERRTTICRIFATRSWSTESRKNRSNDGSIFRWKLVRVQNKTQKARKAFDFAAATYHYVIVLNTPPSAVNTPAPLATVRADIASTVNTGNAVSVGNASIGNIQTGNASSTAIGNTAIVRRTAPRVTRASEKRKEQCDHWPRRNGKWARRREVADSYDKDKNLELLTEIPSPKPTTSRNKVIPINPLPVAEDSSTFKVQ
ncbi:hypothetical protein HBI56_208630 [Parastagonospora nodorum]|nr:hypothetical protein HBH51_207430 [Parastagonospora nodorum]KAH3961226.1 hypothetical protein HBH52_231970 [Parastagonospora nodorum]KAH4058786.1 hypothetical protein HBH50_231300 [Parastagonospora nodorum]KAH4078882.1 hypothetical protein HBH48_224770 [Parastagonospora nodorum]KAH4401213.1 hypothetical protein HBH92_228740 [Parastagonospora nodorum]